MSDTKIPFELSPMFDFLVEKGLRGDEVKKTYDSDTDAAEIEDPVENFCKAVTANRFNKAGAQPCAPSTGWDEPIGPAPKTIAKTKVARFEVETDAMGDRISKGYDERGELISYRVLMGNE